MGNNLRPPSLTFPGKIPLGLTTEGMEIPKHKVVFINCSNHKFHLNEARQDPLRHVWKFLIDGDRLTIRDTWNLAWSAAEDYAKLRKVWEARLMDFKE